MADLNANINVGIETTQALNQLKALQKQISQFHQSVAKSSGEAAVAQRDLQRNFLNSVNSIQGFSAELKTVRTTAESFTNSLEKNKFSMREYFRYAGGATKTFGKNFRAEFSTIEKTAIERVKTLQTQYIKMGRDAQGAMQAIAIRPTTLNMKDLGTQTAIAAQKQVIFNQLVKQGSTNLLNFGKNTQWAGRQLMVGFTLPLATLGMTAGRVFFDMEKAAIKFKKVYGDLFTAPEETKKAMDSIVELGEAYATYGIAVSDTLDLAADAAAAGFAGVDLQNQTTAALKLSVLGQLDLQKALETTISLQNAFQLSSADLAGEIDFLNAVENQTVVALEDITEAVPRVAPVIQALGGDVRDLAFFLAAMKEGGVNAAQGANALKSGLASLINPSEKAATMLASMGVNIRGIISQNQGDLAGTVFAFATALDKLDPLKRAQAIEQLFGKFQFARISALFDNITREGTQAQRVLDLAGSSASELAALSESELGVSAASSMNKFRKSVEQIKVALVPIGELFVKIATPFVEFGTEMLKAFNKLPDGVKTVIGSVITILGGIGPIALMTFGLINNGIANMIKFFATVRLGYLKITGQAKGVGDETQYMTQEQLEAAAAAASLDQAHAGLTQRFTAEKTAVDQLRVAYEAAAAAGARFATLNPGMMRPVSPTQAQAFAGGGIVTGPGTGTSDSIPAMLSSGEAVIPAKQVKEYAPLIEGMIAGNLPGFAKGVMLGMPKSGKATEKNREAADAIYQEFLKSSYANTPPTEYGHQISPTSGHSFPIFGLGGVYEKGGKRVFVKPVMDETAALAEIRGTQITRQAHGLQAPDQRIVVIRDPMDPTRERRFLALESDLDAKFIQNEPKALFNEDQYFRQLVASLVRVDKDLAAGNVFGDVVADVGPAGVFDRASGIRALKTDLPSMEEQAIVNLLGIKGGAKRAFAESTLALMAGLTPEQYHQRMIGEIQRVLPALKKTVADFGLSNPTEAKAYDAMIKRLETGLGVDWSKFHSVHSAVKIAVPKKPKAVPGYANGVVSVPGQKGKGDTVPAMLSPGEAVIPAEFAKKYAPLINSMVAGNIPGYSNGTQAVAGSRSVSFEGKPYTVRAGSEEKVERLIGRFIELGTKTEAVTKMLDSLESKGSIAAKTLLEAAQANKDIKTPPAIAARTSLAHLMTTKDESINPTTGERTADSLVRRTLHSQNLQLDFGQSSEDFSKQWKTVTGGLSEALLVGGLQLTENVKKAAQTIDDEIHDTALAIAQGGEVNSEIVEQATNLLIEKYKSFNSELGQVAKTMQALRDDPKHKVVLPPTIESLKAVGIARPDDTQRTLNLRQVSEGLATTRPTPTGQEVIATKAGAHLTTDPTGRLSRIRNNKHQNRPRRPATELGATQATTYLSRDSAGMEAAGVSVQAKEVAAAGAQLKKDAGVASPSKETIEASQGMVQGVTETLINSKDEVAKATEQMIGPVTKPTQASKNTSLQSSFGNVNTKEPIPAVGNAPRQVVQAMTQETTAARTFAGDLKTSFAKARENITREMGFVKEEFKELTGGIKTNAAAASSSSIDTVQKNLQITEAANNQILVNGKEAGFNYVAAMQGRDGAIEAVVTKGNAAIITKATEAYNSGSKLIPGFITDGLASKFPEFEFMGERVADILATSVGQRAQEIANIPDGAVAATGLSKVQYGPGESPEMVAKKVAAATQKQVEGIQKFNARMSTGAFALSALSGVVSMLGTEFSQFAGIISMLTGGMFALMQITSQLAASKGAELILSQMNQVGGGTMRGLFNSFKGASTGMTGFGKGLAGVAGIFKKAFPIFSKLLPVIGLVTTAFAAFKIVSGIQEEARRKLLGLSEAANMSADKIKGLGDAVGEQLLEKSFTSEAPPVTGDAPIFGEDLSAAKAAIETEGGQEEFEKKYTAEIQAIKDAKGDATRLLALYQSMGIQFSALGMSEPGIKNILNAFKIAAGETDVEIDFKSISVFDNEGNFDVSLIEQRAAQSAQAYENAYNSELEKFESKEVETIDPSRDLEVGGVIVKSVDDISIALEAARTRLQNQKNQLLEEGMDPDLVGLDQNVLATEAAITDLENAYARFSGVFDPSRNQQVITVMKEMVSATAGEIGSLDAAFDNGKITLDEYNAAVSAAIDPLLATGDASENLSNLLTELNVDPKIVEGLQSVDEKIQILNATTAGVDLSDFKEDLESKDVNVRADAFLRLAAATKEATAAQVVQITETKRSNAIDPLLEETSAIEGKIQAYRDIEKASGDAALAYKIVGDAAMLASYQELLAEDAANKAMGKQTDLAGEFLAAAKNLEAAQAEFEGLKPGGSGGSDPIKDSIESLKQQRQEILNTSKAYAGLRKRGMDAGKAMRFAQNPQLMAAMNAGLKVGSKQWDEIIKRIRAAEVAAKRFQLTTSSGQKEYFDEVYGKVQDFVSASENLMRATFEVATAADTSLISKLENKIKDLNSQIENYEYSLEEIAEKEEAINKEYDKKAKALEEVRRINEDILRQQKSQLSIADALSKGDVSAAASAIQQSREENARAALDSQGNLLDIAKQAQIDSLTAKNGLTREQIEKRIKDLKKQISDIERGELAQAQSRIDAAQRKLDIETAGITVLGQTAGQWDKIKAETDKAQAGAVLYNKELRTSIGLVKQMVAGFNNVPGTVGASAGTSSAGRSVSSLFLTGKDNIQSGPDIKGKKGEVVTGPQGATWAWGDGKWTKLAGGGMVKPSYFAGGGKVGYYPMGGLIPYKANGGMFKSVNTDTQPAMLTPGEFVVRRSAVDRFGLQNLKNINNGTYGNTLSRGFNQPVYPEISRDYSSGNIGGGIFPSSDLAQSNTQVDNSVYNYSLSVNVEGTNASPDQIANVVMRKLQDFGSQRVRGQVLR